MSTAKKMPINDNSFYHTPDGAAIYFEDRGRGLPLIMVSGWTQSIRVFDQNVEELSQRYRVIAMDYRGSGNSAKISDGHTVDQYCRDIHGLKEHLRLDKIFLLGWSMSVVFVLRYVQMFGEEDLLGLILVDGSCHPFCGEPWNATHAVAGYNIDAMVSRLTKFCADHVHQCEQSVPNWFKHKEEENTRRGIDMMTREMQKTPAYIAASIYSSWVYEAQTGTLALLRRPVLAFMQENNRIRGEYMVYETAKNSALAELVVVNAGHALFWERPKVFNEALLSFLDRAADLDGSKN